MARTNNLTNFLTDVANAIRAKTGGSSNIACENFDTEIGNIPTGSNLQSSKSVTITTNTTTVIEPDTGYDGMESVSVTTNVQGSYPDKYVVATAWDTNTGYPTEIYIKTETLPRYAFGNNIGATEGFASSIRKVTFDENICPTQLGDSTFRYCNNLTDVQLSKVENLSDNAFSNCTSLISIAGEKLYRVYGGGTYNGCFSDCTSLKAIWIGDGNNKMSTSGTAQVGRYAFVRCSSLLKIYINRKRSFVETLYGYQYAFMNDTSKTSIVVCNDDQGWITKEQFEAIDWENYSA